MSYKTSHILWVDIETTGLSPRADKILEVAAVLTDSDMNVIESFQSVVGHKAESLSMNLWCMETHAKNGLIADCDTVSRSVRHTLASVVYEIQEMLERNGARKPPLGGSSVHFDRSFLAYQSSFDTLVSHRNVDVSSMLILTDGEGPILSTRDTVKHRAYDDIMWSISIARRFRKLWKSGTYPVPCNQ